MNAILDTSCLVSLFLKDTHHDKALRILENIVHGHSKAFIAALSLVELCGVVRRNTSEATAREVQQAMNGLIEKDLLTVVPFTASDAHDASSIAIATGLKGADAVTVQAAKKSESQLFTFDEEIKQKGKGQTAFFEQ